MIFAEQIVHQIIKKKNSLFRSFLPNSKYNFDFKEIKKFNNFKTVIVIGMGGSVLGARAIYSFLKYKITQDDIDRGRARGGNNPVGIVTTTATSTVGISSTFSFEENSNFLQIPPAVLGINKIFRFDGSNTVTNNMFSVKYQLFLNDVYTFSSTEILSYAMTKRYLEDLDFALGTEKYIRFNKYKY